MGALVLNPQDVLRNPLSSRQTLISPPPSSRMRPPKNQNQNNPTRSNRTQQPNRRKRSPNSSPPSRATISPPPRGPTTKNLIMGEVKILKRGEQLTQTTPVKEATPKKPIVKNERKEADLDLGSTERIGPDPEMVATQIRLTDPKMANGFYAGSAFVTSPPPSSLPLPAFFMKKNDGSKNDVAAIEIRKLLGLNLQ